MKKETLLALANLITVFAHNECGEAAATTETTTPAGDPPAPKERKPRGRPAATPPAEPAPTAAPAEPEPAATAAGKTYEDMQAIIAPLVRGTWMPGYKEGDPVQPRGLEVKAIIKKYGTETLSQMDPKHYDAFAADIEALMM